jgi:hypothetical protein
VQGSSGRVEFSLVESVLDVDVFPDDQAVWSHFLQRWQDALDMLIMIGEGENDGEFAACVNEVSSFDFLAAGESGNGV